jgi:hypothetical protein
MVDALGISIFAVEGTLLALGILTVALRVYVRTRIVANFSYDDIFMVIGLVSTPLFQRETITEWILTATSSS